MRQSKVRSALLCNVFASKLDISKQRLLLPPTASIMGKSSLATSNCYGAFKDRKSQGLVGICEISESSKNC